MNHYRGNAIAVGILLIACTATSILSAVPLGPVLARTDYLSQLATSDRQVIWTALLEFAWAATCAGIAVGLYPVIRRHHRALALGSVAGRVAEATMVLIGTLSLLVLSTVSRESLTAGANAASYRATGDALLAVREWATGFLGMLPFLTAALLYYYVLYRARLVPRWLSGWGLAGAALGLIATVYSGYTHEFGFSTVNTVLFLPIGLQEMVLAGWLLIKGFTPPRVDAGADSSQSGDAGAPAAGASQASSAQRRDDPEQGSHPTGALP